MNSDVLIVGAELDAFIASIRLQELGYTSRMLTNGKGSYLYSSGNNANSASSLSPLNLSI